MNKITCTEADQWLVEHGGALYRYALTHLRDTDKAEDVVQETLLAALQSRERFSGDVSVRAWLFGILKHKIIDQFRREAREVPLDEGEESADSGGEAEDEFTEAGGWRSRPADWGDPERVLESRQFWAILQLCLDGLSARHARLFMLREVLEHSSEEICQDLNITPTNLWTMLYRARVALRQCLEKNGMG